METLAPSIGEEREKTNLCTEITPHIYCFNKKTEEIKTLIDPGKLWESFVKRNNPDEARVDAWVGCEGMRYEIPDVGSSSKNAPFAASLFHNIQSCMLDKEFRYTCGCNDEIPVACQSLK